MRRKILLALLLLFPAVFFVNRTFSQAPTISSFSPSAGSIGTLVTITGTNLNNPSSFTIGGVSAITVSNDGTKLVGMVMPGATTGNISITTSGGLISAANIFSVTPTDYPSIQQGDKLVDANGSNVGYQGSAVAISADGNTAVVGDFNYNVDKGAVRIYTRNGSTWSLENTFTLSDSDNAFSFGWTLALNADGTTLVVGALSHVNNTNVVFVYKKSAGIWAQQGNQLEISGSIFHHGNPLAISADGNTFLFGVNGMNTGFDVFTRLAEVWSKQASINNLTGGIWAVSLSADGNTAILGRQSYEGIYTFTRSGNNWTEQTGISRPLDAVEFGWGLGLSADGNTAIVGSIGTYNGPDNSYGAIYFYTRTGNTWTQQGDKIYTDNSASLLGMSTSLSADGNVAVVEGLLWDMYHQPATGKKAAWIFNRISGVWSAVGDKITLNEPQENTYKSLAFSADGNTAIIGVPDDGLGGAFIYVSASYGSGSGVPGGGGGGLESKSLGDAVGNRIFNKAVNSLQGPVDYAKLPVINGANRNKISGVGTSLTLSEILPNQIAGTKYKVFNSTPADIASITNAKDVLSIDFTLNDQAKAVAFGTKTQGEVYDHTKAICDRLKGSELINIENVLVNNIKMVRYDLKNTKGQMEYAFSFVIGAKSGRSNYTIQSNWLNKDYTADEVMYNIQLWAETPSLIMNMATDMMNRLTASMPVKEVLSTGNIPKTYVSKGNRDADNIVMNITNTTAGTNGYFEVKVKDNEQSSGYNTKQVPFTITTNGKASVKVPVGDSYEASINMYLNNVMIDQLFMTDGNWATASLSNTNVVSSFKVSNDPKRIADNKDDYLVYRNIQMEAAVTDYISVYKILRGAGAAQDLTGYKSLLFNAKITGVNMKVILVKEGITNWADQYTLDVPMSENAKDVVLNLNDFVSTSTKDKINLNDITTIIFSLMNPSGKMVNVTANISNVAFSKTDFAYLNSLKSTELNAYPNPSNGRFTASFKSPKADNLTLTLRDAATGIPVFTKLVNAQVGDNAVPVSVERRTGLNTYILTLEGSDVKYQAKKVFMDK